MKNDEAVGRLAINGGEKIRTDPWPARHLFTETEKAAAVRLFDKTIETGGAFCYGGEEDHAYCEAFAAFHGGGYADAVNSGSSAIYVALRALDLEPFTEIIVPPVTDMGGVMPVPLINCIPIPSDTAPNSYNSGPDQIAERVTERTSAIIVAHISGLPVDMDPIMEMARAKGIPVLEDCAQAHGATYKGRLVGAIGDIATFSTMSGKHHATGGQGGVVFTQNEDLYWRARSASDRGKSFVRDDAEAGSIQGAATGMNVLCSHNLNLDDLSAAIGIEQLKKLPEILEGCRRIACEIDQRCQALEAVTVDMGLPDTQGAFWFVVFHLDLDKVGGDLDTFVKAAQAEGVPFFHNYTRPFTDHDWYKNRAIFGSSGYPWTCPLYQGDPEAVYPLPNMERAHKSLFCLKVHENMTSKEADDVFNALKKVEKAFLA